MTNPELPQVPSEKFFEYVRRDNERKAQQSRLIAEAVGQSNVPLPDSFLSQVVHLFPTDARQVLRAHQGFVLSERREHYRTSLSIMRLSLADLDVALVSFERLAATDTAEIMKPKNSPRLTEIEERIQKELFVTANAAASLVDHTRRLQRRFDFDDFRKNLEESFGNDGLHDLVIGLRVLLHHLHVVKAEWTLQNNFVTGERSAGFKIERSNLEKAVDQFPERFGGNKGEPIANFLSLCGDDIDLLEIFREYSRRVEKFHVWLSEKIKACPPEALIDYDRCILAIEKRSSHMSWNALIGNWLQWKRIPNLHDYLANHLTEEQLEIVYSLRRNSEEQADKIIQFLDEHKAIDDALRERIYQLFQRLDEQECDDFDAPPK